MKLYETQIDQIDILDIYKLLFQSLLFEAIN